MFDARLQRVLAQQPYPLLYVTVSGSHLYGFPSPDSDYDLRGAHILPAEQVIGLEEGKETVEAMQMSEGLEIDLVTYDLKKLFLLLLNKNGNALEQIYSPHVLSTTPEHEELKALAMLCVTRFYVHHYSGFAGSQWKLFAKEQQRRVKPLLYIYRVLLTGTHLMRSGQLEPNLVRLNEEYKLPYIPELIERKIANSEQSILQDADMAFYEAEYQRLRQLLEEAGEETSLPDNLPNNVKPALNDLLVRLRLRNSI